MLKDREPQQKTKAERQQGVFYMKLYELVKASQSKNLNTEIIAVYQGLHYQFYANDFENFEAFDSLKNLEIVLICPYDQGMQIYTK